MLKRGRKSPGSEVGKRFSDIEREFGMYFSYVDRSKSSENDSQMLKESSAKRRVKIGRKNRKNRDSFGFEICFGVEIRG